MAEVMVLPAAADPLTEAAALAPAVEELCEPLLTETAGAEAPCKTEA